jgi:hypothetical protein
MSSNECSQWIWRPGLVLVLLGGLAALSCNSKAGGSGGGSGGVGTGGSGGSSQAGSGGVTATGGTTAGTGGAGTGGKTGSGGSTSSGGVTGSGGASSGGASGTGGAIGSGGTTMSSSAGTGGARSGGAGGAGGATAGGATGTGGTSVSGTGGASTGGTTASGTGGSTGGTTGSGGTSSKGGATGSGGASDAGADGPSTKSFTCNTVLGIDSTSEWYTSGFENQVTDSKWQLIYYHPGYVEDWESPTDAVYSKAPTSPCAANSDNPDRVILNVFADPSGSLTSSAAMVTGLSKAVDTIKSQYSRLKRLDLLTMSRGPNNQQCFGSSNTVVASYVDDAITKVVAAYPGLVTASPIFYVTNCSDFDSTNPPHLSATGKTNMAKVYGDYYSTEP